jgi:hypothetical protein
MIWKKFGFRSVNSMSGTFNILGNVQRRKCGSTTLQSCVDLLWRNCYAHAQKENCYAHAQSRQLLCTIYCSDKTKEDEMNGASRVHVELLNIWV